MGAIIVHGGCGIVLHEVLETKQKGCEAACDAGRAILQQGGSAIDAVEEACKRLEDNPVFNAGTGSVLNLYGYVEMDASIMTSHLQCGAIATLRNVKNPITLARKVMQLTDHVLLAGEGANHFARVMNEPSYDPVTPERRARWKEIRALLETDLAEAMQKDELEHWTRMATYIERYLTFEERALHSTVGAVALDDDGLLAVGTSTGGIWFKLPGRVGDTPLIGAGSYANHHGAASATGHGEGIIKLLLTHRAVHLMAEMTAQEACDEAIAEATMRNVECGLIGIDAAGNVGSAYNTPSMPTASGRILS
jgi:beta-aspartyl-peptidase (threonine type)